MRTFLTRTKRYNKKAPIFRGYIKTREETFSNIFEMLPDIHDADMKIIAERVIGKLDQITDDKYAEFNFSENFSEV